MQGLVTVAEATLLVPLIQNESGDGYATSGSYTVTLPDGRVQTVKYVDNGEENECDDDEEQCGGDQTLQAFMDGCAGCITSCTP